MEKKKLSPQTSKEVWMKIDYAIARFMKSKLFFRTNSALFTFKKVKEGTLHEQIQIHLRIIGRNEKGEQDDIDFDVYASIPEFNKLKELLE